MGPTGTGQSWWRLLKLSWAHQWPTVVGAMTAAVAASVVHTWSAMRLLQGVWARGTEAEGVDDLDLAASPDLTSLLVWGAATAVCDGLRGWLFTRVGESARVQLSQYVLAEALAQPTVPSDDVIRLLTDTVHHVTSLLHLQLHLATRCAVQYGACMYVLCGPLQSGGLAVLVTGLLPLLYGLQYHLAVAVEGAVEGVHRSWAPAHGLATEAVHQRAVVQVWAAAAPLQREYAARLARFRRSVHRQAVALGYLAGVQNVVPLVLVVGGLYWCRHTDPTAFAALAYLHTHIINVLSLGMNEAQTVRATLTKARPVLALLTPHADAPHRALVEDAASVALVAAEAIQCHYPPPSRPGGSSVGNPVWAQPVTFHLAPGDVVGVTGPSGCGKSTLFKVVVGLIQPTEGRVRWRPDVTVAWVPPEPPLWPGLTVAENIAFPHGFHGFHGRSDDGAGGGVLNMARVRTAARWACVAGVIEHLEDGYHTRIQEHGAPLSGGQKQRVALARALYKVLDGGGKASVLLLDDPTSALDDTTEHAVMTTLRRAARDHLALAIGIISPRRSTLQACDRVIELPLAD